MPDLATSCLSIPTLTCLVFVESGTWSGPFLITPLLYLLSSNWPPFASEAVLDSSKSNKSLVVEYEDNFPEQADINSCVFDHLIKPPVIVSVKVENGK